MSKKWIHLAIFILEAIQKVERLKDETPSNKKKLAMQLTDDMIIGSGFLDDDKLLLDSDVIQAKSDAIEALVKFENSVGKKRA